MPVTTYHQAAFAWQGFPFLLGQSVRAAKASADIWFYLLILVVASMIVVTLGLVLRKKLSVPIESARGETAFNLSDLRKLHRLGLLSDEEFQAAKAGALAESGVPPVSGTVPKAAPKTGQNPLGAVDESLLGPELLDRKGSPPPTGDSDNPDGDPPETRLGSDPEK